VFSLQALLLARIQPDILGAIHNQYKTPLDAKLKKDLAVLPQLNIDLICATLEEFIATKLHPAADDDSASLPKPSSLLKEWIIYVNPLADDEKEAEKVESLFPTSLLVSHSCALLSWLKEDRKSVTK